MGSKLILLNKMSKKQRAAYYASKRRQWGEVNPVTRVVQDKTRISRRRARQELLREL